MPNGRCRHHGGKSTGPRTPEGKRRVGEASKREWVKHRAALGLPPDWRYVQSRRRGGRQTAAQWLAATKPEEEPNVMMCGMLILRLPSCCLFSRICNTD